jgi:hypothetical protein
MVENGIEISGNTLDAKALENTDTKYQIKIYDKGIKKDIGNISMARILSQCMLFS